MIIGRSCFARLSGVAQIALQCACVCALASPQHAHAVTYSRGFAVDGLLVPTNSAQATAYAIDLNGDGYADNALGNLFASLSASMGLDVPGATATATSAGQIVHLVELRSSDPAFAADAAAEAIWYVGEATPAPPLFDGTGTFSYDADYVPGNFFAALAGGGFVSANPATTTSPVDITVNIQLANSTVRLPLQGARLAFTAVGATLSQGQVNGSVRKTDIDTILIPALAVALNNIVQSDPQSDTAKSILSLFDTNPTDGLISVDEVLNNPLIQTLFAPDVQIRDEFGNYAPNPANTTPDAMSLGIGFSAVQSQIVLPPIFANGFESPLP